MKQGRKKGGGATAAAGLTGQLRVLRVLTYCAAALSQQQIQLYSADEAQSFCR